MGGVPDSRQLLQYAEALRFCYLLKRAASPSTKAKGGCPWLTASTRMYAAYAQMLP